MMVMSGVSGLRKSDDSKVRSDDLFDQFSRRLMLKVLILASTVLGVKYFDTSINCITPNTNGAGGFIGPACWIQGFFVFEPLRSKLDESGYYGIPSNIDYDGINSLGELCSTVNRALDSMDGCTPMTKLYYLQYQYFPFYLAALALIYYMPYLIFKMGNSDLDSLNLEIAAEVPSAEKIAATYFDPDYAINSKCRMKMMVASSVITKALYLMANLIALLGTNFILNGNFLHYGTDYVSWLSLPNDVSHEHNLDLRARPKPGNILLPPVGFCDIHEATRDVRNTHINTHRFICEISIHVLYQYVLVVLWFCFVVGVVVSAIGLIKTAGGYGYSLALFVGKTSLRQLTLREIEYFEIIRNKNKDLYNKVLQLVRARLHPSPKKV